MVVDTIEKYIASDSSESPILISTTEEMGKLIMDELRVKLLELIEGGQLINEKKTKVLIISGTHGDNLTGQSGLTNIELLRELQILPKIELLCF